MKKRILVTGGAGFLGSHLCERLLKDGNDVICLDNFYTGSKENIAHLLDNPGFEVVRHDITVPISLEADEIYNLACPASPVHYQLNPIMTIKTNFLGALNVLGMAKRLGAKVLQASTSEVYGDPEVHPQDESYYGRVNPIGVRSCYDEGKRAAECLMTDYRRQHGVKVKIARIFNTYGPRMAVNDGRVVSNFIIAALRGKDLCIYGDGSHSRSFCYVSDMIDGLVGLMNSGDDFFGPVNIGNPSEISILDLAKLVIRLTESKSQIVFEEATADDPVQRKPDIALAERELGWKPTVELEKGLMETIGYFRGLF
jgi:UDP-glucuronate decarboxylase